MALDGSMEGILQIEVDLSHAEDTQAMVEAIRAKLHEAKLSGPTFKYSGCSRSSVLKLSSKSNPGTIYCADDIYSDNDLEGDERPLDYALDNPKAVIVVYDANKLIVPKNAVPCEFQTTGIDAIRAVLHLKGLPNQK